MELKDKLISSFMAFEEHIDVHASLHTIRTSSIKNFESGLKENLLFYRIHKSYLTNTHFVEKYDKSNGGSVTLSNKKEITISP